MKIWIDLDSGTWGDLDTLVTVDLDEVAKESSIVATGNLLLALESSSDSQVWDFGKKYGKKAQHATS